MRYAGVANGCGDHPFGRTAEVVYSSEATADDGMELQFLFSKRNKALRLT